MQERRTLVYIKEENIPASAVAITANNYTSVLGNVIYFPLSFISSSLNGGANASNFKFLVVLDGLNNIKIISINGILFKLDGNYYLETRTNTINICSSYDQNSKITLPRIDNIYCYSGGSSITSFHIEPYHNSYSTMMSEVIDTEKSNYLYSKIKLDSLVKPYSNFTAQAAFAYINPIYIDTE